MAIKKIEKIMRAPNTDKLLKTEDTIDTHNLREKIFDRFTVSRTVLDGQKATKVRLLAVYREGSFESTEIADIELLDILVPALNWGFFTKNEVGLAAWCETLCHQRFPTAEIDTADIWKNTDCEIYQEFNRKHIVAILLADNSSWLSEERITTRKQCSQYTSIFYPGCLMYASARLHCVKSYDWSNMNYLLHSDFAPSFNSKKYVN